MKNDFEKILNDLKTDEKLKKAFKDAKLAQDDFDGLAAFAKAHGYDVTADEIKKMMIKELTPEELSEIAGGIDLDYIEACYLTYAVAIL